MSNPWASRMVRLTLTGAELAGLDIGLPAASIRILLPRPPSDDVVLPVWNGNEFLDEDGTRPVIRTLTPLGFDADRLELAVEIVLHGDGPLVEVGRPGSARRPRRHLGDGTGLRDRPGGSLVPPGGRRVGAARHRHAARPAAQHGRGGGVHRGRRSLGTSGAQDAAWRRRDLVRPRNRGPAGRRDRERRDRRRAQAGRPGVGRRRGGGDATAASPPLRRAGLARSQVVVRGYWKQGRQGDPAGE